MHPDLRAARSPITVAISGATGLIGRALVTHLRARGHTVRRLVRAASAPGTGDIPWNPAAGELDARALDGVNAIVHLAGAPIAERWSSSRKREIRESRVASTSLIARVVERMPLKPDVVLSGSAIGYYGDRGDEQLDERSAPGNDFLARVVRDWEAAAAPIADSGVRLVLLRTGIVLSADGGALEKLLLPFKLGAGGPVGGGRQWMSWIALADHVRAMEHALFDETLRGPVNLVSPNPVTNATFATTLGRVLHRPALIPVPALAVELMFGEMARATILAGQRVAPRVLAASEFEFGEPTLEGALRSVLQDGRPG